MYKVSFIPHYTLSFFSLHCLTYFPYQIDKLLVNILRSCSLRSLETDPIMAVEIKHTKNGLTIPEDRSNGPEEITMERQFGFWSGCALGIINGCSWALTGATIVRVELTNN